jgi:hypothetical protein
MEGMKRLPVHKEAPFIFVGKVVELIERSLHTLWTTSGGGSSETKSSKAGEVIAALGPASAPGVQ